MSERLNRFLARAGIGSRRQADRLVAQGRVTINGQVAHPGARVRPHDAVCVDGVPVHPLPPAHFLYHKRRGEVCTRRDPDGRPRIFDHITVPDHVQSIGRLDIQTEGLLLLTSDGRLARALTDPERALVREYRARVWGHPDEATLARLLAGGIPIGRHELSDPWEIVVEHETRSHTWLRIRIRRGRWREVRRTLAAIGHPVARLIRTRFGPLVLDPTRDPPGSLRPLNRRERLLLYRAAGLKP